jgi:hypothetical protein
MSESNGALGTKKRRKANNQDLEARFLRLYSRWHETHDLTLRKRLFVKVKLLMRECPDFDLRSRFNHAF